MAERARQAMDSDPSLFITTCRIFLLPPEWKMDEAKN